VLGSIGGVALVGGIALAVAGAGAGIALVVAAMLAAVAVSGLWLGVATRKALATRRLRVSSGREALNGRIGVVRSWEAGCGQVLVDGALWRARPSWPDDEMQLGVGDPIVVEHVNGLTLGVRRAEEWEEQW
jgi:membrane protein implicated in regulation of membrane protease activity